MTGKDSGRVNEPTLTGLPIELRLQIYDELFQNSQIVFTGRFGGYADRRVEARDRAWPILLSCQLIYNEALPAYWSRSRVEVYTTWRQLPSVLPVEALGRIEHLCLRLHTLSTRWANVLADLGPRLPKLKTLVIREEGLCLASEDWRGLDAADPSTVYEEDFLPWLGHDKFVPLKKLSHGVLKEASYPLNRVLYVPLTTDGSMVVPWTGSAPGYYLQKALLHNFGNDKTVIVSDMGKPEGLQCVLA
jgi:hypothetical protein